MISAGALALAGPVHPQDTTPINGRLIPIRDTHLWVEDYGPRDAPALLYVHGGPGLGVFEFSHFMRDLLSRRLRLILVDQRGVLRSDPWTGDPAMSLGLLSDDYEMVRQSLGIPGWTILGHSWGGPIALWYATRHAAVERVIFENAVLDADSTGRNMLRHAADMLDASGKSAEAARVRSVAARPTTKGIWDGMDSALNSLPNRQSLYVHDPACLGFYGRISAGSGIPDERWTQGMSMALALLRDPEALTPAWNRLSMLSQPTLLIRGQTDPATSDQEISAVITKPNVSVVTVPRSGHFVHVEQPAALAEIVTDFVLRTSG
jgi:proline iminopeptidase